MSKTKDARIHELEERVKELEAVGRDLLGCHENWVDEYQSGWDTADHARLILGLPTREAERVAQGYGNPTCEACKKQEAVVCCADALWRCEDCCYKHDFDTETGEYARP